MESRLNEVHRCKKIGINGISEIDTVTNKSTNEISLFIKTHQLLTFNAINNSTRWPKDAFGNGVKVECLATHLEVRVLNFEKDRDLDKTPSLLAHFKNQGLEEVRRDTTVFNNVIKQKSQLTAKVRTIAHFIQLITEGIIINPRHYKVEPIIKYNFPCSKCGNLYHKTCKANQRCTNCSDQGHDKKSCNKPVSVLAVKATTQQIVNAVTFFAVKFIKTTSIF